MSRPITLLSAIYAVLAAQLGSDLFQRRERAMHALEQSAPYSLAHVYLGAQSKDTERRRRCEVICRQVPRWAALITWPRGKPLPWLWDGYFRQYQYGNRFVRLAKDGGCTSKAPDFAAWRKATWYWMIQQYQFGATVDDVRRQLRVMEDAERRWKQAYN